MALTSKCCRYQNWIGLLVPLKLSTFLHGQVTLTLAGNVMVRPSMGARINIASSRTDRVHLPYIYHPNAACDLFLLAARNSPCPRVDRPGRRLLVLPVDIDAVEAVVAHKRDQGLIKVALFVAVLAMSLKAARVSGTLPGSLKDHPPTEIQVCRPGFCDLSAVKSFSSPAALESMAVS